MKKLLILLILTISMFTIACENANEGVMRIQVVRGEIKQIIKPRDGWVNTLSTVGDSYYDFSIRSYTEAIEVDASTKDNAAVKLKFSITANPLSDDESIKAHVRKFGLDEEERKKNLHAVMFGQISTEAKNAIVNYDAYALLANQEAIQKKLLDTLKPTFKEHFFANLESVQITSRPDFVDDRIEQAASAVVANQKAKEAAEADLARSKVEAEKKQVESQTFKDPAMLKIKELELLLEIERARADGIAKHQGALTIVNGGNTQLQIKGQ